MELSRKLKTSLTENLFLNVSIAPWTTCYSMFLLPAISFLFMCLFTSFILHGRIWKCVGIACKYELWNVSSVFWAVSKHEGFPRHFPFCAFFLPLFSFEHSPVLVPTHCNCLPKYPRKLWGVDEQRVRLPPTLSPPLCYITLVCCRAIHECENFWQSVCTVGMMIISRSFSVCFRISACRYAFNRWTVFPGSF